MLKQVYEVYYANIKLKEEHCGHHGEEENCQVRQDVGEAAEQEKELIRMIEISHFVILFLIFGS